MLTGFAGEDSLTSLSVEAARKALEMAQVDPDDVDLVLMCTSTPEDLFGSAPQVYDIRCIVELDYSEYILYIEYVMCILL